MCTPAELAAFRRRLAKVDPVLAELIRAAGKFTHTTQRGAHAVSRAGARHRASAAQRHGGGKHLRAIRRACIPVSEGSGAARSRTRARRRPMTSCARSDCRSRRSRASRISRRRPSTGIVPPYEILHTLADDEIIERLTQVRGIGRWTVEMLLMFRLGRPDVLPVDDFGVRNGFRLAYGLRGMPTTRALAEYGARWAPLSLGRRVVPVARGGPARAGKLPAPGDADAHQAREEEAAEESRGDRRNARRRTKTSRDAQTRARDEAQLSRPVPRPRRADRTRLRPCRSCSPR